MEPSCRLEVMLMTRSSSEASRLNTTTVQIQSNLAAGDRTCERLGSDGLSDNSLNTSVSRDGSDRV